MDQGYNHIHDTSVSRSPFTFPVRSRFSLSPSTHPDHLQPVADYQKTYNQRKMCVIYHHHYECSQAEDSHAKTNPQSSVQICPKGTPRAPMACIDRQDDDLFCGACPECERIRKSQEAKMEEQKKHNLKDRVEMWRRGIDDTAPDEGRASEPW
jgi:hypothetical protein